MEIYPKGPQPKAPAANPLDTHLPDFAELLIGWGEELETGTDGIQKLRSSHNLFAGLNDTLQHINVKLALSKLFSEKQKLDGTELAWSFVRPSNRRGELELWKEAAKSLANQEFYAIWNVLARMSGGDRINTWEPDVLAMLAPNFPNIQMALIPAVREIGAKGSESDGFNGAGIIERLARLQNPDVHSQPDRIKFDEITRFVGNVIDNPTASIEVPHDRETILVHMDGKTLPLSSLGSGIHEVIILAAAATVLSEHIICIEEPEIHLNPRGCKNFCVNGHEVGNYRS